MEFKRKRARILVDIGVTLTTVLDSLEARIIDLSEHGAQIVGASVAKGSKFQIEYIGQIVYAQCMWSEIDRMGVRFPFGLANGPLHDALMMAIPSDPTELRTEPPLRDPSRSDFMPPPTGLGATRRAAPTFGRRG